MKNFFYFPAIAFLAIAATATAADRFALQNKGRSLGDNPNPVICGTPPAKPAPQPPPPQKSDRPHRDAARHGYYRFYYPNIGSTYCYSPCYTYSYAYPSVYYLPSADNLYGPVAVQRFMGMDHPAPPVSDAESIDAPAPRKAIERGSNARANVLAWRFIGFGDAQFAQLNFAEANSRYRSASRSAPQLADAWFRQGFALSAMERNKQAVDAVKRGLRLKPDWAKSDFDLRELFDGDELAKNAVLDARSEAVEENPHDADRLFMLGILLHFDGQTRKAEKYFDRAMQLAGDDIEHIRAFLPKNP